MSYMLLGLELLFATTLFAAFYRFGSTPKVAAGAV